VFSRVVALATVAVATAKVQLHSYMVSL